MSLWINRVLRELVYWVLLLSQDRLVFQFVDRSLRSRLCLALKLSSVTGSNCPAVLIGCLVLQADWELGCLVDWVRASRAGSIGLPV